MPTGYTDIIDRTPGDVSFNQFAWLCARAFGAFVNMRDDSLSKKLTLENLYQKPGTRCIDKVTEATLEIAKINNMSDQDCETAAYRDYVEATDRFKAYGAEKAEMAAKYRAMRMKVMEWKPASEEHNGLVKFMLEQLEIGKPYEFNKQDAPKKKTGAEWRASLMDSALRDVAYYAKEHQEDIKRCNERNEWIKGLVDSIGMPE
jgi:hypothetical protein